jgi:hypothetical protein
VDHEPGVIHAHAGRVVEDVPFEVDLHQVRRGDLVEHQPVRVDEHVVRARHAGGEVGVNEIGPPKEVGELVGRGEIDAGFPFLLAHAVAKRGGGQGLGVC